MPGHLAFSLFLLRAEAGLSGRIVRLSETWECEAPVMPTLGARREGEESHTLSEGQTRE